MEIFNMEDQLVTFETAKLAKEVGFDIPQDRCYVNEGTPGVIYHRLYLRKGDTLLAYLPTQSLLQKWLREVHTIHINISKVYKCNETPAKFDGWNIYIAGKNFETNYEINNTLISKHFKTYEEALESGLQEA